MLRKYGRLLGDICDGKVEDVEKALSSGIDINYVDGEKNNLLHYAVDSEQPAIVKLLVDKDDTKIIQENNSGVSPLSLAKRRKFAEIIAILSRRAQKSPQSSQQAETGIAGEETWEYQRRGEAAGVGGQLYETKLLALILFRAQQREDIVSLQIGANVDGLGAFDDLVVRYKIRNQSREKILCIQAKHRENSNSNPSLTVDIDKQDDFSLCKYLDSYLWVRHKFHKNNKAEFFKKNFDELDMQFIIYTNAEVSYSPLTLSQKTFIDDNLIDSENNRVQQDMKANKLVLEIKDDNIKNNMMVSLSKSFKMMINFFWKKYSVDVFWYRQSGNNQMWRLKDDALNRDSLTEDIKNGKNDPFEWRCELNDDGDPIIFKSNSDYDEKLINEFMEKMIIYHKQAHQNDVEMILKQEIGMKARLVGKTPLQIHLIYLQYHESILKYWMQKRTVKFLIKSCDLFEQAQLQVLNSSWLEIISKLCMDKINRFKLVFRASDNLSELLQSFVDRNADQKNVLVFKSKSQTLGCARLIQTLEPITKKFVFIDIDYILAHQQTSYAELFESNSKTKIDFLVAAFGNVSNALDIIETFRDFACKVLLVFDKDLAEYYPDWHSDSKISTVSDNIESICDLTVDCQENFLRNIKVKFSGLPRSLHSLMIDQDSRQLIDTVTMQYLLEGNELKLAELSIQSKHDDALEYYIDRTLRPCTIAERIIKETSKFCIIKNFAQYSSLPTSKQIILISDKQEEFENLCEIQPANVVHWLSPLSTSSTSYVWRKTHSSQDSDSCLLTLREFLDPWETNIETLTFENIESQFVILTAEPGMGKSTFLSNLADSQVKNEDQLLWTVRIDLLNFTKYFASWKTPTEINEVTVIDFILRIQHYQVFHKLSKQLEAEMKKTFVTKADGIMILDSVIEQMSDEIGSQVMLGMKMFLNFYNHGKIFLLIDGYDEIAPKYETAVLTFLRTLKACNVMKVWITTRPSGVLNNLEDALNTLAYTLEPFSTCDSQNYLIKYWKANSELHSDSDLNKINEFTEELMKRFMQSIGRTTQDFISIPLQTKMLGIIFQDTLKLYIQKKDFRDCEESFKKKLDLITLYETFINIKLNDILLAEKCRIDPTNPILDMQSLNSQMQLMKRHTHLSLYALFDERSVKILLSEEQRKEIDAYLRDVEVSTEKVGIIYRIVDKKPIFVHQTFAEYFSALHIWQKLKSSGVVEFDNLTKDIIVGDLLLNDRVQILKFMYSKAQQNSETCSEVSHKVVFLLEKIIDHFYHRKLKTRSAQQLLDLVDFLSSKTIVAPSFLEVIGWLKNNAKIKHKQSFEEEDLTPLHLASQNGHKEIVVWLLEKGTAVNSTNKFRKCTPLHLAAIYGFEDVCRVLIENGAEVNAEIEASGATPLHYAAQKGRQDVAKLLIDNGAMIEARTNPDGFTALHYAAQNTHTDLVALLLREGCDKNAIAEKNSYTPLHLATMKSKYKNAQILIEAGANVDQKTMEDKKTALHFVSQYGSKEILELVLNKGANVNESSLNGYRPIHFATISKASQLVKILLDWKAEVNCATDDTGKTPLHFAAELGLYSLAKALIKRGAATGAVTLDTNSTPLDLAIAQNLDENFINYLREPSKHDIPKRKPRPPKPDQECTEHYNRDINNNWTEIHTAAYDGDCEKLRQLLLQHEDINVATSNDERTPLHVAAERSHCDFVKLLLDSGANASAAIASSDPRDGGFTAFHCAAEYGNEKVVEVFSRYLPEKEYNFLRTNSGMTPMHVAAYYGRVEIINSLYREGLCINDNQTVSGNTPLHLAIEKNRLEAAKCLLALNADVNIRNNKNHTPLYVAFKMNKCIPVVKQILKDVNMDINATHDNNDSTALHLAAHFGYMDILEILIERRANVNASMRDGRTPLHIITENSKTQSRRRMVERLLRSGANVNAVTTEGKTPLHFIAQTPNKLIAELLCAARDVNVNLVTLGEGYTALHFAAEKGFMNKVKMFIHYGADKHIRTRNNNRTALELAEDKGHMEIAEFLR